MGVTPAELWARTADDPEQLDLMIASIEIEHDYGPHGQPIGEATDPKADPNYYGEGAYRYIAHHQVDFAQRALIEDMKALRAQLGADADLSDMRQWVEKREFD